MSRNKPKSFKYTKGLAPTRERQHQFGGVICENIHEKNGDQTYTRRHRALFECALDAYLWFGMIDKGEYEAGMKFRKAYLRFVCKIRVDEGAGSHGDPAMGALMPIISERILKEAYAVLSKKQQAMIINVCGHNQRAGSGGNHFALLRRGLEKMAKTWNIL